MEPQEHFRSHIDLESAIRSLTKEADDLAARSKELRLVIDSIKSDLEQLEMSSYKHSVDQEVIRRDLSRLEGRDLIAVIIHLILKDWKRVGVVLMLISGRWIIDLLILILN